MKLPEYYLVRLKIWLKVVNFIYENAIKRSTDKMVMMGRWETRTYTLVSYVSFT